MVRDAMLSDGGGMDGNSPLARNVAIFLDMENLYGGNRNEVGAVPLGKLVRTIEQIVRDSGFGRRTATVRAYANWGNPEMASYRRETMEYGVEPVQIFSFDKNVKNAADIELCVDVLSVAQESPWVEVFVIATGDGGFIPLVRRLHALNKYVVVVSTNEPAAGFVNSMLKSVADEYHQVDVLPPAAQTVAVAVPTAVKVLPKVVVKPAATKGSPTALDLRALVIKLVKNDPQVMIDGQVNASALGQLLRKTWPNIKYASYDTKTLSGFVEKHCGMVARRPGTKKPKVAIQAPQPAFAAAPKKSFPVIKVASDQEYLEAIRHLFENGGLGELVHDQRDQGMSLDTVSVMLKAAIEGRSPADTGFAKLNLALQHVLEGTAYYVVQTADKKMAVVHASFLGDAIRLRPTVIPSTGASPSPESDSITTP